MSFAGNSSYIFGIDDISGWGSRYFFTFYSEFGDRNLSVVIEIIIFLIVLILSIITNITIAAAVLRYPEMRTVTNCFLLNLTVADILFVCSIPALAYTRVTENWKLGNSICKLLPFFQFVCGFVLLWTLTWISMDRHRCIVVPPFRSQLTPRRATVLTTLTWIVGIILFLPVIFVFRTQLSNNNLCVCTLVFPRNDVVNISLIFVIVTVFVCCVIPLSLFVYHYQRIFSKLNETKGKWICNKPNEIQTTQNNILSQHEAIRINRHLRAIRILLINVIVVLIMWLPITVVMFLIYVDGSRPNEDTNFFLRSHHFIWALQIALINTVVNPLLYGVLSENFRNCFIRMWFLSQRKKQVNKQFNQNEHIEQKKAVSFIKIHLPLSTSLSYFDPPTQT